MAPPFPTPPHFISSSYTTTERVNRYPPSKASATKGQRGTGHPAKPGAAVPTSGPALGFQEVEYSCRSGATQPPAPFSTEGEEGLCMYMHVSCTQVDTQA